MRFVRARGGPRAGSSIAGSELYQISLTEVNMGKQSGYTYGLRVSLAFSAFQASRIPPGPVITQQQLLALEGALDTARNFADWVASTGIDSGGILRGELQCIY